MAQVGVKPALYGSERESRKNALQLAKTLQSSSVLGAGEYNYTYDKLCGDVWQTSCARDFPGLGLDRSHTVAGVTQLNEHFRLGNDSGKEVPWAVYTQSTTADDFTKKNITRDMAPQYRTDREMGMSEYVNTFTLQNRSVSAPVYPKVHTSTMQLPLDPVRFHRQRGSEYKFGNDPKSHLSEHTRAFGRAAESTNLLSRGEAGDVGRSMKALERQSNVFRSGDYNGALGNKESTTVNDFGPRTCPPAESFSNSLGMKPARSENNLQDVGRTRAGSDLPNMLTSYARDVIVPGVFSDAEDGRDYQTNAHFQFGSSADAINSVYGKDYKLSAMAPRAVPRQAYTKDAGNVLQKDPEYSHAALSLKSSDFMAPPRPLNKMSDANAGVKYIDHVNISLDPSRHASDRQKSIAHSDFNKHPYNYHPLPPFVAKGSPYKYLETDKALPYPGLTRGSEAGNNFTSSFMHGIHALDRRRQKDEACKDRAVDRKGTHFVVGYAPGSFTSESLHQYQGRKKNDRQVPPAGKTEIRPKSDFLHLGHSQNVQDLSNNDPHLSSTMEGLHSRHLYHPAPGKGRNPFQTSIMKEDYKEVPKRSMTSEQLRMVRQNEKLASKTIENSHFFHTDNSMNNQFRSVTMHDFIQPEQSTGVI